MLAVGGFAASFFFDYFAGYGADRRCLLFRRMQEMNVELVGIIRSCCVFRRRLCPRPCCVFRRRLWAALDLHLVVVLVVNALAVGGFTTPQFFE